MVHICISLIRGSPEKISPQCTLAEYLPIPGPPLEDVVSSSECAELFRSMEFWNWNWTS